jgi:hypothetical protein
LEISHPAGMPARWYYFLGEPFYGSLFLYLQTGKKPWNQSENEEAGHILILCGFAAQYQNAVLQKFSDGYLPHAQRRQNVRKSITHSQAICRRKPRPAGQRPASYMNLFNLAGTI